MLKLVTVLFLEGGGLVPLRTLLSSRVVASAIVEKVGAEFMNDNIGLNIIGYMIHQCYTCRVYDFVSYGAFMLMILYLQYGSKINDARIGEIDGRFTNLKKITGKILWVLLLVLAKNIENAI